MTASDEQKVKDAAKARLAKTKAARAKAKANKVKADKARAAAKAEALAEEAAEEAKRLQETALPATALLKGKTLAELRDSMTEPLVRHCLGLINKTSKREDTQTKSLEFSVKLLDIMHKYSSTQAEAPPSYLDIINDANEQR